MLARLSMLRFTHLLNLLLIFFICWQIAPFIWSIFLPKSTPAPLIRPTPQAALKPPTFSPSLHWFAAKTQSNTPNGQIKETSLAFKLTGLIAGNRGVFSAAMIEINQKTVAARVGDTLQQGVTLKKITPEFILLDNQGSLERLYLFGREASAATENSEPSPAPPIAPVLVETNNPLLQNLSISQLQAGFSMDANGLSVQPSLDPALQKLLHLQTGDILQQANGALMRSPEDLRSLFAQLKNQPRIELVLLRQQQPVSVSVLLKTDPAPVARATLD